MMTGQESKSSSSVGANEPAGCPVVISCAKGSRAEEVACETFDDLYRVRGAILLRGAARSSDDFVAISDRFGRDWIPYQLGGREMVSEANALQTVNTGLGDIPPHGELCHLPLRPEMAWFYCDVPPSSGGQTTLYDGAELAADMPTGLKAVFADRAFRYQYVSTLEEALQLYRVEDVGALRSLIDQKKWSAHLRVEDGRFMQDYRVPAFALHASCGKPVFVNQLVHNARFTPFYARLARGLAERSLLHPPTLAILGRLPWRLRDTPRGEGVAMYPVLDEREIVPRKVVRALLEFIRSREIAVQWQAGDVLVFDNTRFMHGRRRVDDDQRRILTRFGFRR